MYGSTTVKEHFGESAASMARMIQSEGKLLAAVEQAGLDSIAVSYISTTTYTDPWTVTINFGDGGEDFRAAARKLAHAAGKAEKGYDETRRELSLSGMVGGVKITLVSNPPSTCTVEKVEEQVEVAEQVIPAHTKTITRYVMKGDCDPLMSRNQVDAAVDGAVEAVEAVGVTRG